MNRYLSHTGPLAATLVLMAASACADSHGKDHGKEDAQGAAAEHHQHDGKSRTMPPKETKKPDMSKAELYIISPVDGAVVTSPVRVQFGLRGMGVAPAGADLKNTGHHHLLIDVDEMPDMSAPLPATDNIRHFGGGQTEGSIELAPGEHSLQLLLGDFIHRPHNPPVISDKITITVKDGG